MTMLEERKMILEMLAGGDITVEEAERLLGALGEDNTPPGSPIPAAEGGVKPKRLVVLVKKDDIVKTNVRIPFTLVRFGLKMGAKYGGDNDEVNNTLRDLDVDEILRELENGEITLPYKMVDVQDEEKNETVEVILE
ncbi:MAG: SHOCT-like domain-containing protein [Oscillospiraceae bacterium]